MKFTEHFSDTELSVCEAAQRLVMSTGLSGYAVFWFRSVSCMYSHSFFLLRQYLFAASEVNLIFALFARHLSSGESAPSTRRSQWTASCGCEVDGWDTVPATILAKQYHENHTRLLQK
jgi:hypothetical protein